VGWQASKVCSDSQRLGAWGPTAGRPSAQQHLPTVVPYPLLLAAELPALNLRRHAVVPACVACMLQGVVARAAGVGERAHLPVHHA
jgi:hypothetical protein